MLHRLKFYSQQIYERFERLNLDSSTDLGQDYLVRGLESSYENLFQAILIVNETWPDKDVVKWLEDTPLDYKEDFFAALGRLQESLYWARQSIYHGEDKLLRISNLNELRIDSLERNSLHKFFCVVCKRLHRLCPHNLYAKFAIIRLINCYYLITDCTKNRRTPEAIALEERIRIISRDRG